MKWEYKVVNDIMAWYEMNTLGREGWELVSHSLAFDSKDGWLGKRLNTYIFKRKLP